MSDCHMKTISPTQSYTLNLPDDVVSDGDDQVFSWWRDGSEVLLQISSYRRSDGSQVTARERLNERCLKEEFLTVNAARCLSTDCPDVASASGVDSEGIEWHYYYLVWPDLAVFASVSGRPNALLSEGGWTILALNSLKHI